MKKLYTIIIFLHSLSCFAQGFDLANHLTFHSDFEEKVFSLETDQFFFQALATGAEVTQTDAEQFQTKLDQFFAQVKAENLLHKNKVKGMKRLFDAVHETFLEVYRRDASIDELYNGTYNCVTASCLYVTVLDHFSIPFTIIESPNHVYLIAYPNTDFIVFETTSPFFNNFQYNKKEIKQLSKEMVSSKMVRASALEKDGFLPVYFVLNDLHNPVERKDLLSFLYGNRFVHEYDIFDKQMNQDQLDKAKLLSTTGSYDEMYTEQVIYNNYQNDPRDSLELVRFILAANINKNRDNEVIDIFDERMTEYRYDSDLEWLDFTFRTVEERLESEASVEEIRNIYWYNCAIHFARNDKLDTAIALATKLYNANPEKQIAKSILEDFLLAEIEVLVDASDLPAEHALGKLEALKENHPFIGEGDDYLNAYFQILLNETETAFGNYKLATGESWMSQVIDFQDQYGDRLKFSSYRMEIIYAYWSDCLSQNKTKRMEVINRGLELYPRSERLMERKEMSDF